MKATIKFILAILIVSISASKTFAGIGDTTTVRAHDNVHMSWWGNYDAWGVFPAAGTSYRRVNLDLTLGCPSSGCSGWDYTVQVEALRPTGTYDSTLVPAPYYTVGTTSPDTIFGNLNPVYVTYFDTIAGAVDSTMAASFWVMIHNNPNDPFAITDSVMLYTGGYYNHIFDNTGNIIDSIFISNSYSLINSFTPTYNVFEVIERIELARMITPYGGYFANTWHNTLHYDITDLAPLLQDSVKIRAFYGGWSDGFTLTLDFHFIEGTPPRNTQRIRNVYVSGPGGFPYGNPNNSIENYLTSKTFDLNPNETMATFRVIPTGHGAGTLNCSEFCQKNYKVLVDGTQRFNVPIWRSDCGKNHLYHQAGTWLYDRANWCPGEKGLTKVHDLTPYITPGSPVTIDMNMDSYTNSVSGQNPNYIMAAQLITYGAPNFNVDASVEDIIAPSNDFYYNRMNPICQNPVIVIKNTGATTLTSAVITFGINGANPSTYNWSGNLAFNQMATIQLGPIDWNSTTSQPDQFYAYISSPNGTTDQNNYNDTLRSHVVFPTQLPSTFILLLKTNTAYNETSYNIKDDQGNVIFSNGILAANTTYRDTISLAPGCYTFNILDSGKDGLSFFANNDGTGYARFLNAFGSGVLRYFEADFGTSLSYQFTVGYLLTQPEIEKESRMNVYPNPTSGQLFIDISMPNREAVTVQIMDARGRIVKTFESEQNDSPEFQTDLSGLQSGLYIIRASNKNEIITKKLLLQH